MTDMTLLHDATSCSVDYSKCVPHDNESHFEECFEVTLMGIYDH